MSLRQRLSSFRYAIQGLRNLIRTQVNARIHVLVAIMVVFAGILLDLTPFEWIAAVLCMALVLGMEAANTAIEYLTDLVSPEIRPLAGKAKDLAAAAVLIAAMGAFIVGMIIFAPKIYALFDY